MSIVANKDDEGGEWESRVEFGEVCFQLSNLAGA